MTIILYRRELTFINALIGQLGCEGFNWFLKRLLKQPRPHHGQLGKGYGMPSSHSQFVGFFAAFFVAHFCLHHPNKAVPRTLINTIRRAEHVAVILAIVLLTGATCYSRYHLSYHTPAQIIVGLLVGLATGGLYYYVTEYVSRKPLRLPAPLGSPDTTTFPSSPGGKRRVRPSAASPAGLRRRMASNGSLDTLAVRKRLSTGSLVLDDDQEEEDAPKRRSSLSSFVPELHPAPPLRQIILDHPLAVALRIRDSWTVWRDGGIEGEYGAWRREWERRREWCSEERRSAIASTPPIIATPTLPKQAYTPPSGVDAEEELHYGNMLDALRLADQCAPTSTAFCVGCVIAVAPSHASLVQHARLADGYSRELEGNTHAEQNALTKIDTHYQHFVVAASSAGTRIEARELALDLYTTMEPCSERLSGAAPCVDRILAFNRSAPVVMLQRRSKPRSRRSSSSANLVGGGAASPGLGGGSGGAAISDAFRLRITRVLTGVEEPEDFIQAAQGTKLLREAGIEVRTVRAVHALRREVADEEEEDGDAPRSARRRRRANGGLGQKELDWEWLQRECLRVAKFGHPDQPEAVPGAEEMWRLPE